MATHRKHTQVHRVLGTLAGVSLAVGVLPGISVLPYESGGAALVVTVSIFVIVNQLIYSYPNEIRTAPAPVVLLLAVFGFVQDTLVWLLVSFAADNSIGGHTVDGFLTALLGGLLVRGATLAALYLVPRRPANTPA
jgi:putative membrane protein